MAKRSKRLQMQRRSVSGTTDALERPVVSEIIGRSTTPFSRIPNTWRKTVDATVPEYAFWSSLARGKEPGYELGSLFAKRIAEVDAEWTLGRGFTADTGDSDVDDQVSEFVHDNLDTMMTWRKDSSKLGDSYIIVNPDASLSLASPDTAEILTDPLDYTTVIGYRFTTVLDAATVIDEYRLDGRFVIFQRTSGTLLFGTNTVTETVTIPFQNLIGMIPVIHLPNDRESNEIYGHPIYEALLTLFGRYDDVLQKSLDGVEIMGRPIPVAEGLEDPEEAMRINSTHTEPVKQEDGTTVDVPVVDFEDLTMMWLGNGGTFKFAAPGSFSADSVAMLKKLFYLMLEHTGIPEWAWGGAVASSKASVEAQMPAFIRYLEGRRTATQNAVRKLTEVWLATKRLTEPMPVVERVKIEWPELQPGDETMQMNKANSANDRGVVTDETYLRLLDLVDDPEGEVKAAREENQTKEDAVNAAVDAEIALMNQQNGTDQQNPPGQQPVDGAPA